MDSLTFLQIDHHSSDLTNEFERIAKILFEQFVITNNDKTRYCLADIEFYLLASWHQDFYIYLKEPQKLMGRWLKHNSGIDFTFGNGDENMWAGILIRGIIEMKNYRPINGCWNVYDELRGDHMKVDSSSMIIEGLSYSLSPFRELQKIGSKNRKGLNPESFKKNANNFNSSVFPIDTETDINDFLSRKYRFYI